MQRIILEEMLAMIYYLIIVKRKQFDHIAKFMNLNNEELIFYINLLNMKNNQYIPIDCNGKPKIAYSKIEYKVHKFRSPKKIFKIMFVADKHIDHVDDRVGYIHDIYNEGARQGVDFCFDLGDILNGPAYHNKGLKKEKTGTLDGSLDQLKKYHPDVFPTYFITGNHDLRFMGKNKVDIGALIDKECTSMVFLNNLFTIININDLVINLSHGSLEMKELTKLHLNKEYTFLNANNPHIICQAHNHIAAKRQIGDLMLVQIPALKSSVGKFSGRKDYSEIIDKHMGAVILSVYDRSDAFEIRHEIIKTFQTTRIDSSEIILSKKPNKQSI